MVVEVLTEQRDGVKKERSGEEGRFALLVTSLLDTLQIDLGVFYGKRKGWRQTNYVTLHVKTKRKAELAG